MSLTDWPEVEPGLLEPLAMQKQAEVRLPPLDELANRWHEVAPLLERATSRTGCYEPIDVLQLAMAGRFGVWLCEIGGELVAAVVTEVAQYPRRRACEIVFCGGTRMREWVETVVETIDRHARDCGCSHVAILGRSGWVRAGGYTPTGDIVMVREV